MNANKYININPKDIPKILPELILKIILKDGTNIISDETMSLQDINNLINNKKENREQRKYQNSTTSLFNYNINNYYDKDNKTLDVSNSFLYNHYNKNDNPKKIFFDESKFINKKIEENKNNNIYNNEKNQTISDIVNEKFHKKFKSHIKENKLPLKATINSEIKINIKGNEAKKGIDKLLKDFNELVSNFNYKKKGMLNNQKDKNKYRYYKKSNILKKDKLILENLSGISPNSKSIKYIGRNENNITDISDKNLLGKNRVSYLKEKELLKRNKSNHINHIYYLKESKFSNIISPPNYLHCNKMEFI